MRNGEYSRWRLGFPKGVTVFFHSPDGVRIGIFRGTCSLKDQFGKNSIIDIRAQIPKQTLEFVPFPDLNRHGASFHPGVIPPPGTKNIFSFQNPNPPPRGRVKIDIFIIYPSKSHGMPNKSVSDESLKILMKSKQVGVSLPQYLVDFAKEREMSFSTVLRKALEDAHHLEYGYIYERPTNPDSSIKLPLDQQYIRDRMSPESIAKWVTPKRTKLTTFRRMVVNRHLSTRPLGEARRMTNEAICNAIESNAIVLCVDIDRRLKPGGKNKPVYYVQRPTEDCPKTEIEDYRRAVCSSRRGPPNV